MTIPVWRVLVLSFQPITFTGSNIEGLFIALWHWSAAAYKALLYLNKPNLEPLPIYLRNILMGASVNNNVDHNAFSEAPIQSIKAASVFLTMIPMITMYPFVQRYFTKGTLAGSIKG